MALINLFNSASLRPVSHTSSISAKRAELLACYLIGGMIDIRRVIKTEINEVEEIDLIEKNNVVKKPIPFLCLIIKLYRKVGVLEYDGDKISMTDKGDLNLRV
ncbi:hypothetical protein Ddye_019395 [Dipteronia dyeriana]|uniref:Uncharacterized protein n=1 Tax=Dipteronia dyeriana TaxID=168575 RepID=A0AAD9TYP6_9ROSI|nr:hypothetical protein Ddye_019395 [Dipteronia dyeriana]